MSMRVLMATLWLAASLLAGCGTDEEGIVLEIHSDLVIPIDVDTLRLSAASADDGRTLGGVQEPLTDGQKFPIEVALIPSASTPEKIIVHVTAERASAIAAEREVQIEWSRGHIVSAPVDLRASAP